MYLSHFELQEKPFEITTDPKFLWLGEKHREALAVLNYGVLTNQGFLLLTGDVGTGKTTLVNTLAKILGPKTLLVNVADPSLDKTDFFRLLAHGFGLVGRPDTKFDFALSFQDFLNRAHAEQKQVLLIVDEAQKLSLDLLEEIRLLSNIEKPETKLLNVFFVGQNEFNATLQQPQCRALRQRITIVHNIGPLSEEETAEYVKYRLWVAGAKREIFTGEAIREIFQFSKGYPRLINKVCDFALVVGYANNLQTIDPKVIQESSRDLSLPGETKQQAPGMRSKEKQEKIRQPFSWKKATIFAVLGLLGSFLVFGIPGSRGLNLQKFYATLAGLSDQDFSKASPEKNKRGKTDRTSSPAQTAADSSVPGNPFRTGRLVINFASNVSELSPNALVQLSKLASYLLRNPQTEVIIKGYTDNQGDKDYNRNLSTFRANVVKTYLTGKGIKPNRMKVIGMGDEEARMPNTTDEGRNANRRVEIELAVDRS